MKGKEFMGWSACLSGFGRKKKRNVPQVAIFSPSMRLPSQSHLLHNSLKDVVPKDIANTLSSLRDQIASLAEDIVGGSTDIDDLQRLLENYLSLILGLTKKEHGLQNLVEFSWKSTSDSKQEMFVANSWFEVLSVVQIMATLALRKANLKIIPTESVTSADFMSEAVELLLRAAGYLDFCIRDVLVRLPADTTSKMPGVLRKGVMEATINQALAQGTEIQLGLAVGSQNATLSVKRRLACELVSYLGQAHYCLSNAIETYGEGKKQLLFIKWKYLEGKAAAFYYHGLMVDKGTDVSCHVSALSCFLAAEEVLSESKKSCLSFCLADPVTRPPPPWGVMKHLNKKIHETASKKFQMHGFLLDQDKGLGIVPELPEFQLSLRPEEYELPVMDSAWDRDKWAEIRGQNLKLKEHLKDGEDDHIGTS